LNPGIWQAESLCGKFHITMKPYWLNILMNLCSLTVAGAFFGEGKASAFPSIPFQPTFIAVLTLL